MWKFILLLVLISQIRFNPQSPEDFVWKNRILICESEEDSVVFSSENQRQNIKDRKLLIFQFSKGQLVWTNFQGQIESGQFLKKLNAKNAGQGLWILIGLDGGIKKSGEGIPKQEEIYRVIDAMPMRQSELRSGSNGSF